MSEHLNFAKNLSELCKTRESITLVCKDLGINRQQFARYLNGQRLPRFALQEKIAAYFDTTVAYLHSNDTEIQNNAISQQPDPDLNRLLSTVLVNANLETVIGQGIAPGWYQQLKLSFSRPGFALLSIAKLEEKEGQLYYSLRPFREKKIKGFLENAPHFYYSGLMLKSANRILMFEMDRERPGLIYSSFSFSRYLEPGILRGLHLSTSPDLTHNVAAKITLRRASSIKSLIGFARRLGWYELDELTEAERFLLLGNDEDAPIGQLRV